MHTLQCVRHGRLLSILSAQETSVCKRQPSGLPFKAYVDLLLLNGGPHYNSLAAARPTRWWSTVTIVSLLDLFSGGPQYISLAARPTQWWSTVTIVSLLDLLGGGPQ